MSTVTVILTDRYSDWEIGVLCGLGRAFYGADIRFTSPEGGPLNSVAGLPIADTESFEPPSDGVVVICGGPAFESDEPPDIGDRLMAAHENGCVIAGICGGTVAMASAGLLDDHAHTSNWPGYLETHAAGYAGSSRYVEQPMALRGGRVITAPAGAPASFAAEVLEASGLSSENAAMIRSRLAAEFQP